MRRTLWLVVLGALVVPLVCAAGASAQGSTLLVSNAEPNPGQSITVTGGNFTSTAGFSPVNIRLNTRSGQVLASPTADSAGRISATFPIPLSLAPGYYLLVATQTVTANNRQRSFTPGRARIRVKAVGTRNAAPPGGTGRGLPDAPLGLIAVGAGLIALAAGGTVAARRLAARPGLGG